MRQGIEGPERGPGELLARVRATAPDHQGSRNVLSLIWTGKLEPMVDRVMPLSGDGQALEIFECREKFGNIVLVR